MSQFFGALTQQLRGSGLADPGIDDAMTIIAALGYAQHPVASPQLATALGWSQDRLNDAISQLRQRATLGDPFILSETGVGYSLHPRPDRLSAEQRAALNIPVRRP
jgi:biotin operon repressor